MTKYDYYEWNKIQEQCFKNYKQLSELKKSDDKTFNPEIEQITSHLMEAIQLINNIKEKMF